MQDILYTSDLIKDHLCIGCGTESTLTYLPPPLSFMYEAKDREGIVLRWDMHNRLMHSRSWGTQPYWVLDVHIYSGIYHNNVQTPNSDVQLCNKLFLHICCKNYHLR